jgi:hypothetical protein
MWCLWEHSDKTGNSLSAESRKNKKQQTTALFLLSSDKIQRFADAIYTYNHGFYCENRETQSVRLPKMQF